MFDTPSSPEPVGGRARHGQADGVAASSGKVISVALIDDNSLMREGIASLLGRFPDIRVTASDSKDFEVLMDEAAPDVVLLELDLIHTDSMEIARALRRDHPETRVVLMDHVPAREDIVRFVEAGACGFIHKDGNLNQVLLTIRSVASGLDVLPDPLFGTLFSEVAREAIATGIGHGPEWARLTDREREVLGMVSEGSSNKAISKRLHISIHTVKSHLRNVMEKLALHSRLELAHFVHTHSDVARPDAPVSAGIERQPSASRSLRTGPTRTREPSRRSADLV